MKLYSYLFSCAYWVSINDLNERSAPQEYALFFISVIDVLVFVIISGVINLIVGHNILSGSSVILVCGIIVVFNYFFFLRNKRYLKLIEGFESISKPESKGIRIRAMISTFTVTLVLAILTSIMNNSDFQNWLT